MFILVFIIIIEIINALYYIVVVLLNLNESYYYQTICDSYNNTFKLVKTVIV